MSIHFPATRSLIRAHRAISLSFQSHALRHKSSITAVRIMASSSVAKVIQPVRMGDETVVPMATGEST